MIIPLVDGDRVMTIYGDIETVMFASESQVVTYESARRINWWHPSKVTKIEAGDMGRDD